MIIKRSLTDSETVSDVRKFLLLESFEEHPLTKEIKEIYSKIDINKNAPKDMKREKEKLQYYWRQLESQDEYKDWYLHTNNLIDIDPKDRFKYMGVKMWQPDTNLDGFYKDFGDIDLIIQKFGSKVQKNIVKDGITYIKEDTISPKVYKEAINEFQDFFKEAKKDNLLSKALKNLVVRFKTSKEQKASASYKSDKDEVWINLRKILSKKTSLSSDDYGHPRYILTHELGHRYIKDNRQSWNYDAREWITTKYSEVDSWSGEEKFAELFAISYYNRTKGMYSEYQTQIDKFMDIIS